MTDLAKLNRLRVNAGKPELKSWKASGTKLAEAIKTLEDAGHTDALPGADVNAKPVTDDPVLAAARPDAEAPKDDEAEKPKEPEVKKQKAQLARGLETESMARQSRLAVQMERDREKREERAEKDKAKAEAKEEKKSKKAEKLPKGQVDPKKDPEKAKRQEKHIADKKKAREGKPAKEKNDNEITVADIARELNIDPKVARAKLRRHEAKIEKLHTKGQDRWTFPKSAKAELIKILK